MRRHELEHIIRAASDLTNEYEFVVIGSQSILGSVAHPPPECVMSLEADTYPLGGAPSVTQHPWANRLLPRPDGPVSR
jgi:hypothetical protein